MRTPAPTRILLLAMLAATSGCAEFDEEAGEAMNTIADPDSTGAEVRDEVGEAAKSVLPGEQKEGDIEVELDGLNDALQDLEMAIEGKARPNPKLQQELAELRQFARDVSHQRSPEAR